MDFRKAMAMLLLLTGLFVQQSVLAEAGPDREEDASLYHLEGDTLMIDEGVTLLGIHEQYQELEDGSYSVISDVQPEDIWLQGLDLSWDDFGGPVRRVVLPKTLRVLGGEALTSGILDELRMQGSLPRVEPDALYGLFIGQLTLAADYVGEIPLDSSVRIAVWNVEEGNPRYSVRDGVLFSADGKTLISYPNARSAEHYDVPAGTETIGRRAFSGSGMDISLRSVSLPVGLKRIEAYAFSGCGRLASLTVPLTVTDLDASAFRNCLSLERLSLPAGMTADIGDWVQRPDFTWFNGDNGGTGAIPREREEWEEDPLFRPYDALLDNEAGLGSVPLYADSLAEEEARKGPAGTAVQVCGMENGRLAVRMEKEEALYWVLPENLAPVPENIFFTLTGADLLNPVRDNPEGIQLDFAYLSRNEVVFFAPQQDWKEIRLPLEAVRLIRSDGSPQDKMGLVCGDQPSVWLQAAPEGETVAHLFFGAQARVLEDRGEWLRIETAEGEGWIPEKNLIPVLPASVDAE